MFLFRDPVKPKPWNDILNASDCSPSCVNFGNSPTDPPPTQGFSENCLYLNAYLPAKVNSNSSLPVMVWIYGGGFNAGNSEFDFLDPTPLVPENVIVVLFNYRLGVLKYLSTGNDVILGNAGLKDQVLALKWVKENIATFGGYPEKVTIFGQSPGGALVGYHVVGPMSRELCAILQSGCALPPFIIENSSKDAAYNMASQVDSSITNKSTSAQVMKVLQKVDLPLLLNITKGIRGVKHLNVFLQIDPRPFQYTLFIRRIFTTPCGIYVKSAKCIFNIVALITKEPISKFGENELCPYLDMGRPYLSDDKVAYLNITPFIFYEIRSKSVIQAN